MKHFSLLTVFLFILFAGFGCADLEKLKRMKGIIDDLEDKLEQAEEGTRQAKDALKKKTEEEKDALKRIFE